MAEKPQFDEPELDTDLEAGLPDVVEADPSKVPPDEGDKGQP